MRNNPTYILLALSAFTSCASKGGSEANAVSVDRTPVEQLREKLISSADSGRVLFGHHDDPVYGHDWVGDENRSDVLAAVGEYPAVMSWDLGGLELGDSVNLDGVPFERIRREVAAQAARGGINTFSWHPRNPFTGGDSWDCSDRLTVSKMVNDSVSLADYRATVGRLAGFFNSLKDASGKDIPVIFRPWHEMTGSWFFWGADNCSRRDYLKLWTEMRAVMDQNGVDNLLWAYSPDRVTSREQYLDRYPGDDLVDIVGTDVYHFNGAEGTDEYVATARRSLAIVGEVASERDKIPAFTETGLESLEVADWYTSVLLPVLRDARPAYVVVWRNAHDKPTHYYVPFENHKAMQSFRDFHSDSLTVFVPAE